MQIARNAALATWIRGLPTSGNQDNFKCGANYNQGNSRQEEICQVFMLL